MPHRFKRNPYLSMSIQSAWGDHLLESLAKIETSPPPRLAPPLHQPTMVQQIRNLDTCCCCAARKLDYANIVNIMPTSCQHQQFPNQTRNPGRDWKRQKQRLAMMQKRKRQSPRTANVPWLTCRCKPCLVALHQGHHSLPEVLEACLQTQ